MSSPITMSGFNDIDFNSVLEALMAQERRPVDQLTTQQAELRAQRTAFGTLATRLSAFESASRNLASVTAFSATKAASSNEAVARVSSASTAPTGSYSLAVSQLARSQVTVTNGAIPDSNTTIVATGGSLTIGGTDVAITGDVTLEGLASAINATDGIGVNASVVRSTGGAYQLVLTSKETGAAAAFGTPTSALTGGAGLSFAPVNAQDAQDAHFTINNVAVVSASNTVEGAIPGTTLTLQQATENPVTITITGDLSSVEELVKKFTSAYNDLVSFLDQQTKAYGNKERDNIGGDPLVRQLRSSLSRVVTGEVATGGAYTSLAQVGLTFNRTGQLEFRNADLQQALTSNLSAVKSLFQGGNGFTGAFGNVKAAIENYTSSGGLIPTAQTRLGDQVSKITSRIDEMERRLLIRREAMQKEFMAADLAIAQLNASKSQLGGLSSSLF